MRRVLAHSWPSSPACARSSARWSPRILKRSASGNSSSKADSTTRTTFSIRSPACKGICSGCRRLASVSASARSRSCRSTAVSTTGHDHRSRRRRRSRRMLDITGDSTSDFEDIVVATKIRVLARNRDPARDRRPLRDQAAQREQRERPWPRYHRLLASLLSAKTVQSVRFVGNAGLGILGDPTRGDRQNDVLLYGALGRPRRRQGLEVVGEINGRSNTRGGVPLLEPTVEPRSASAAGTPQDTVRLDAACCSASTSRDPDWGFTDRRHVGVQGLHGPVGGRRVCGRSRRSSSANRELATARPRTANRELPTCLL